MNVCGEVGVECGGSVVPGVTVCQKDLKNTAFGKSLGNITDMTLRYKFYKNVLHLRRRLSQVRSPTGNKC